MKEIVEAWDQADEFTGVMMPAPGTPESRPVMSKPPRYVATRKFIREVSDMLGDVETSDQIADWIIDKMERFGANMAEPVFDMDGNGPVCSWCKTLWPLCGHQHQSQRVKELNSDNLPIEEQG